MDGTDEHHPGEHFAVNAAPGRPRTSDSSVRRVPALVF